MQHNCMTIYKKHWLAQKYRCDNKIYKKKLYKYNVYKLFKFNVKKYKKLK